MERDQEKAKLVNVLRRTARLARQSEWMGGDKDAAAFCVAQYNRVLARLTELDPSVGAVFQPLAEGSSLTVAAMACRQLSAYYDDEVGGGERGWARGCGVSFDPISFKSAWKTYAHDLEDLGDFIRESIDEWARQRRQRSEPREGPTEPVGGE
jgi:hypothetical protein